MEWSVEQWYSFETWIGTYYLALFENIFSLNFKNTGKIFSYGTLLDTSRGPPHDPRTFTIGTSFMDTAVNNLQRNWLGFAILEYKWKESVIALNRVVNSRMRCYIFWLSYLLALSPFNIRITQLPDLLAVIYLQFCLWLLFKHI